MIKSANGLPPVAFWEANQVVVTLQSIHPLSTMKRDIVESVNIDGLNTFLIEKGFRLTSLISGDVPLSLNPLIAKQLNSDSEEDALESGLPPLIQDFNLPIGKYLFRGPAGEGTSVIGIFHIEAAGGGMPLVTLDVKDGQGWNDGGQQMEAGTWWLEGKGMYNFNDATATVVNLINSNLSSLRMAKIPIVSAMPNWLNGGTPIGCSTHGCPVSPPTPVTDTCANGTWKLAMPNLPEALQSANGEGVTVLVLDTQPTKEAVVAAAGTASGKANPLLLDIVNTVVLPDPRAALPARYDTPNPMLPGTGKDIYGRLVGFPMEDHGLFIAGMIRDLVPGATVECVRVLNDFGVGNTTILIDALERIQHRLLHTQQAGEGSNLQLPLVINLSLVATPADEDLAMSASPFDKASISSLRQGLEFPIRSLAALGVVFVASAGNDSDIRPDASMSMFMFGSGQTGGTTSSAASSMATQATGMDGMETAAAATTIATMTATMPVGSMAGAAMSSTPLRIGPRYPAAFAYDSNLPGMPPVARIPGIIPVGAMNKRGEASTYSNYPGPDGITTYGGDLFTPSPVDAPAATALPLPVGTKTQVVPPVDGVRGVYTAAFYPSPSKDDNLPPPSPQSPDYPEFQLPQPNTWAYWAGTSFATPIISALAARVLQSQSILGVPFGGGNIHATIKGLASQTPLWDRVDATASTPLTGYVIAVSQECTSTPPVIQ